MFNLLYTNCLAPSDILIDLGLRMFVGSHDIPKDIEKASELFLGADQNAVTEKSKMDVQYYLNIFILFNSK